MERDVDREKPGEVGGEIRISVDKAGPNGDETIIAVSGTPEAFVEKIAVLAWDIQAMYFDGDPRFDQLYPKLQEGVRELTRETLLHGEPAGSKHEVVIQKLGELFGFKAEAYKGRPRYARVRKT